DNEKEISSEGEESFLPRTRRRIIPASEFLTCTAAPDFSASQALGMFQETCCMDYGRWQYGSTSSTGDDFPQFHLDMGSLVGLPLRSVILEGSSSANGDNGLDLALCESITRLEKWMTKYGIEDGELYRRDDDDFGQNTAISLIDKSELVMAVSLPLVLRGFDSNSRSTSSPYE
ncbi:hypothetical protein E4U38_000905, partial [Claviceps purpurea]